MAEEKHRMLYQGQEPWPTRAATSLDAIVVAHPCSSVAEPPAYNDAITIMSSHNADQVDGQQQEQGEQQQQQRVSLPHLLVGRLHRPQIGNSFAFGGQPRLGDIAIPIICPACGQNGLTRLARSPNNRTHTWALWLCSFGWCCCACLCPYFMDCCRTTSHYCSNCQIYLGAYYPNSCSHQ